MAHQPQKRKHFLIVTFPAQSHINPALQLAKRLARSHGSLVTFSTTISCHRRMFPSGAPAEHSSLSHVPYSDGYDEPGVDFGGDFLSKLRLAGAQSLTTIAADLAARGRPVTCIIHALFLPWVADLAIKLSIPSVLYWIQPATVFAVYYHYFHGYEALLPTNSNDTSFAVSLPGLPPLRIRDLPSFITTTADNSVLSHVVSTFREQFEALDREEGKATVLVNTIPEAEEEALAAVRDMNLIPVGPMVQLEEGSSDGDLMKHDEEDYMEWMEGKGERSVVYVSFGTFAVLTKRQVEEIRRGLRESGSPYLWVLRKDSRWEGMEMEMDVEEKGMVVEWCSQRRVLSHPSVGCFVTHCGWNSTVESLVAGVPTVGMPQWGDQPMNAWLAEEEWGTAVRAEAGGDGVVGGEELRKCLEVVMGEGERGVGIRRMAAMWRERSREAVCDGGSSFQNLSSFVQGM